MSDELIAAYRAVFAAMDDGQPAVVEIREDEGGRRSIAFGVESLPLLCCTVTNALGMAKTFEYWGYQPNLVELLRLAACAIDPGQEVTLQ